MGISTSSLCTVSSHPLRPFFCDPVLYDEIFFYSTPAVIFRVGRTCKTGRLANKEYVQRKFNADRHFSRFFPDPIAFRSKQAETGAVVSGSNALQFLNRTTFPEADLDIYVTAEWGLDLCLFLVSDAGGRYNFERGPFPRKNFMETWADIPARTPAEGVMRWHQNMSLAAYNSNWMLSVLNFTRKIGEEKRTIQVIVTVFDPLSSILSFHSTVVMNAITFDRAISLFPIATFEKKLNLLLCPYDDAKIGLDKYNKRGWTLVTNSKDENITVDEDVFGQRKRWVGDDYTWTLPFDTQKVADFEQNTQTPTADITSAQNTIVLGSFNIDRLEHQQHYAVTFGLTNTRVFSNRFIACREMTDKLIWFDKAVRRLATRSHGKMVVRRKQCDEFLQKWNNICEKDCGCLIRHDEESYHNLATCAAFKTMRNDFPEMNDVFCEYGSGTK